MPISGAGSEDDFREALVRLTAIIGQEAEVEVTPGTGGGSPMSFDRVEIVEIEADDRDVFLRLTGADGRRLSELRFDRDSFSAWHETVLGVVLEFGSTTLAARVWVGSDVAGGPSTDESGPGRRSEVTFREFLTLLRPRIGRTCEIEVRPKEGLGESLRLKNVVIADIVDVPEEARGTDGDAVEVHLEGLDGGRLGSFLLSEASVVGGRPDVAYQVIDCRRMSLTIWDSEVLEWVRQGGDPSER